MKDYEKTSKEIAMYAVRNYGDNDELKSACIQGAAFANNSQRPGRIYRDEELERLAKWFIRYKEVTWAELTDEMGQIRLLTDFYNWINAEAE